MEPVTKFAVVRLDLDSLLELASVHARAFPSSGITRLGPEAVRRYYEWQMAGPHDDVIVAGARLNGDLVGFAVAGRFRGAMNGYLRRNRWFLASRIALRPAALLDPAIRRSAFEALLILRRYRPSREQAVTRPVRQMGLLSIGVVPEHQGSGVADVLMAEVEHHAATSGCETMNLTVDVGNTRAIRFYERRGWDRWGEAPWQGRMTLHQAPDRSEA